MDATVDVVTIRRRYRGPPDSANGGYACGLVGRHLQAGARVRLHSPPPLDQPLTIRASAAVHLAMAMGEQVIASGTTAEPAGDIPAPVSFEVATSASAQFRWSVGHPFPGCFVCGPERRSGDGLCIFPGPVTGRAVVAAPWVPDETVCDATGHVQVEVLWAALDCPSWFGLLEFEADTTVGLLGQLTAHIVKRPVAGEPCVALGWSRGRDGRKLYGGAALFTSDGTLLGSSDAIWIEPRV
jgi:hypothetical protein